MLDAIVCSVPLVWLFSPAWDAIERTLEVGSSALLTLPIIERLMIENFLPIPDAEKIILDGIKANLFVRVWYGKGWGGGVQYSMLRVVRAVSEARASPMTVPLEGPRLFELQQSG